MQLANSTSVVTSPINSSHEKIELSVLCQAEELDALSIWREFESSHGVRKLACSVSWTSLWLKHYGAIIPHEFIVGRANGDVIGMALVTSGVLQYNGPFQIKTYHLGTAGEPDSQSVCVEYNSVACCDDRRTEFIQAITDDLRARSGWERVLLDLKPARLNSETLKES